jgi:uroporphyrinogen-III synthase
MGLHASVAPLFEIEPLEWHAPEPGRFDALLFTSANGPRHAGLQLQELASLTGYCVGEATAAEARRAGVADVRVGPSDANAVLRMMVGDGIGRVLHLCGRDRLEVGDPRLEICRLATYVALARDQLAAEARDALVKGATVLLHSPRAAALFGRLVNEAGLSRSAISVAAISEAAAEAAGTGWAALGIAEQPRDQPLLEVAAKLCNKGAESGTGSRE